jgi:hypothetical protein
MGTSILRREGYQSTPRLLTLSAIEAVKVFTRNKFAHSMRRARHIHTIIWDGTCRAQQQASCE